MNTITRNLISLCLLAALASCTAKPQVDPADVTPPAANANSDVQGSGESGSNSDATAEKPKPAFRGTRMRLPDMEGLPSSQDLSPVKPTESGAPLIARPPVE